LLTLSGVFAPSFFLTSLIHDEATCLFVGCFLRSLSLSLSLFCDNFFCTPIGSSFLPSKKLAGHWLRMAKNLRRQQQQHFEHTPPFLVLTHALIFDEF
jgi:hypothetical protein